MVVSRVGTASWLAVALAFCASAPALAQHAGKHDQASAAKAADEEVAVEIAGQTASVDPKTGQLRALSADEAKALMEGISRYVDQSGDGLIPVYHASGAVSIDLDERFQSVSIARTTTDGKVATRCVGSGEEAEAFLSATQVAGKPAAKAPVQAKKSKAKKGRVAKPAPQTAKARPAPALTTTAAPLEEI